MKAEVAAKLVPEHAARPQATGRLTQSFPVASSYTRQ